MRALFVALLVAVGPAIARPLDAVERRWCVDGGVIAEQLARRMAAGASRSDLEAWAARAYPPERRQSIAGIVEFLFDPQGRSVAPVDARRHVQRACEAWIASSAR